jgi:hypothetical protein
MKQLITLSVILICLLLLSGKATTVRADSSNPCTPDPKVVSYPQGKENGFDIEIATKLGPPNPIVIGQDEEKIGVDIEVVIRSYKGSASYDRFGSRGVPPKFRFF